jgi:hypothetical protein
MLTDSALFFLHLCNEYRDLQQAKAKAGVSAAWVKQAKTTPTVQHRQPIPEVSDDDATAPEVTSGAASGPSKKRIINSDIAVVSHVQMIASKKSCKASRPSTSTSGNLEKVRDKEPIDVQTGIGYGGIEDKDDNEEWEAIKLSPVKGPEVCISDHVHRRYVRLSAPC